MQEQDRFALRVTALLPIQLVWSADPEGVPVANGSMGGKKYLLAILAHYTGYI